MVFPQIPQEESWSGSSVQVGMAALEAATGEFKIDESRVYLTGLSLGGQGVWQLAYDHPERFAALVPVCGFIESGGRYPDFVPESEVGLTFFWRASLPIFPSGSSTGTRIPPTAKSN